MHLGDSGLVCWLSMLRHCCTTSCRVNRQWIQARVGVIVEPNPEHELAETKENLASISLFLVPKP